MQNIIANVSLPDRCDTKTVTCVEVNEIISAMANNKAGDCYGLRTENYKLAGSLYYSFFSGMYEHYADTQLYSC